MTGATTAGGSPSPGEGIVVVSVGGVYPSEAAWLARHRIMSVDFEDCPTEAGSLLVCAPNILQIIFALAPTGAIVGVEAIGVHFAHAPGLRLPENRVAGNIALAGDCLAQTGTPLMPAVPFADKLALTRNDTYTLFRIGFPRPADQTPRRVVFRQPCPHLVYELHDNWLVGLFFVAPPRRQRGVG